MNKKKIAKAIAATLEKVLQIEANSTSCLIIYQPKMPDNLRKYRKK